MEEKIVSLDKIYSKDNESIDVDKLNAPYSIHGMPGMGMAGKNAIDLMVQFLPDVKRIHEVYSTAFPSHVVILQDGSIKPPKIEMFLYQDPKGSHDIIFITGDIQPSNVISANNLSYYIIDYLNQLGTARIISLAATPVSTPKADPRVYMTATSEDLIPAFREIGVKPFIKGVITGMNGTVPALAKLEHDMDGVVLLSETYPQFIEDTQASASLIKILKAYLDIDVDTKDLEERGKRNLEMYEKMMRKRKPRSKLRGRDLGYIS